MSVKEAVHKFVDEMPDDSPELLSFYERLRRTREIEEARESVRLGHVSSGEEILQRYEERCLKSRSA